MVAHAHAPSCGRPRSSSCSTASGVRAPACGSRDARSSPGTGTPASTAASAHPKLTLDHVVPRHRGGAHSWDNLVAACSACNHRKGGRLPEEAGMRLRKSPREPSCDAYSMYSPYLADPRNEAWRDYLHAQPLTAVACRPSDRPSRSSPRSWPSSRRSGATAMRPTWWAAGVRDALLGLPGHRLGRGHRRPTRAHPGGLPGRHVREPLRHRAGAWTGDHHLPARPSLRRPSPAGQRHLQRRRLRGPGAPRPDHQRHRLGTPGAGGTDGWWTPRTARATCGHASCGRSATPADASTRTPCGCCAPCASRPRSTSASSR